MKNKENRSWFIHKQLHTLFQSGAENRTRHCFFTIYGAIVKIIFCFVSTMLLAIPQANATRPFTFSNDSTIESKGEVEAEQWITWKTSKDSDSDFDELFFNLEIEYGMIDRLQLSFYVDWRYRDGASVDDDGVEFRDVAIEGIYQLKHPET